MEYVSLDDDGSAAARRFHERVRNPLLTDISIDWNGLPVTDLYPQRIPDLFSAKPVVVTGRFTSAARGTIRLKGKVAGNDFTREVQLDLPETMASHDVLASLWARARIDNLLGQDYAGAQSGAMRSELKDTITQLGIEYRLMTQFTSFVAVEEMIVTDGGQPRRIDVPVEVPEGVNREAVDPSQHFVGGTPGFATYKLRSAKPGIGGAGGGGRGGPMPTPAPPPNLPATVSSVTVTTKALGGLESRDEAVMPAPPDQVRQKVHPSVFVVIERLRKKETPASITQPAFVRDGKAEVQIWLNDKTPEAFAKLKELGFEVVHDPKTSKVIIGRVPIQKLEELALLQFVKYVSPQLAK